ncbi:VCBS domain-containing protein, partial [Vibrio owensii]|uniref:VCBS domain-containing protein n=1 Tax=Vibrio owensii TaxID=696485 RepID=UPI003AACD20C
DANGHWVFTANNAFNQLNVGDKVEETFTVTSVDGTPSTIKVTINGTNDAATVSSATVVVDETDTAITTSGTLTSTDVDNQNNAFTPDSITGTHGDLTIDANGHWVFTANSAFNQLNVGDKVDETFTVASVDGTQSTIKVTINGTNDRPTISGTSSGAVIEQGLNTAGTPDATGSLTATDLDKSDTVTWAINQPQGQWGTLSIDQNGHWHYQLDNSTGGAADKLAAGEHQSESFWITATDSAGATVPHKVVIDVQGSNDKPIVSAWTQLPAGKEDQPVTIKASDLLAHASDVDSNDVLHVTNLQATHGSLTDNKDGTYTFTPDKDFNGEIRLTYDVVDGHGGSVSTQAKFDLTAAPDNAIITDAQTNADLRGVTEDRGYIDTHYQLHYDGKLNIQDPDAGEAQFDPNIGPQTYQGIGYDTKLGGHILLMRDGHYTYTLDNRNIQNLAQGEVKHDSAVIRSADGTTHTIELTVHGTNDAPTINAQSHSVTEGGSVLNGQMVGQDIDTGATLTYSAPQIDGLVVNPDGSYSFNPAHSSYQSLASGVTKTLTVPVTVTDEHNTSSTQNLSITITGVNNSAVIGSVDTGNVTEGNAGQDMSPDYAQPGMAKLGQAALTADGKLNIIDPDSGEAQFDPKGGAWNNSYHGQYGHLILNTDGTWHYDVTVGNVDWVGNRKSTVGTTIDQLGDGQTLTDTITIQSKDGTTHDIVITIHGDNDRPYCSSEVQLNSGKEDLAQTITTAELLANTVDVDANDAGKLSIANLQADHGSILDNNDGTYTFTPDKNYNGQVHFTYDVKDSHGGVTHTGANTTLAAVNDAATISGQDTGALTEDHHVQGDAQHTIFTTGVLNVVDPDAGEDHFSATRNAHALHDPYGGTLTIGKAGDWSYSVPNGNVQHLGQGESEQVQYEVQSAGGDKHIITLTIHGTNDDPVLSVTQTTPTTGTLTETDVDTKDTHTFSVVSSAGQFGSLSVDPDSGAYVYTANGSVAGMSYNAATHTYHGIDVFEVKVADNHGGESSKFITFDANGHVSVVPGQSPTISTSVPSNPLVTTTQPSLPAGTNTPPNNAVTVDLAASSDTGTSDTDNLTKDSTPTITGHTDIPYSQVTIYDGSTPIGHAVSDGLGQYSVAVSSLSNGDHNLSAKALAPSSVLPATSSILPLHVDTVVAPLQVSLTHDTGSNSSDLITSDGSLTITGQETGATVEYSTDNGHTWTSSFTPQQGSNTVSVRQTDIAGNVSTPTSLTFTYDAQTVAPSIDMKASTDSGVSTTDDLTNIHTPIITGTAEANSAISITDETGKVIATGTANSSGVYQLTTSDIAEGKHTLTVSSTDVAGNQISASLPVEVDYTAPTISNVNLKTETTHQPTFSGTVSLDTTSVDIVIKSGSTIIETLHATLDGKGGYSVDATNLPDHSYTAYIQATDKAGNSTASGYAGTFDRFSVDTHASAPTISFESTGADNLYNATEVASGAASTITSTIHLPSDAHPKDTLTINGQSHQITDAEFLAKSVNIEVAPGASITASITDKNGNTSTVTNATAPSADITVAPLQVSLTHDTGGNSSDLITNDGSLTIAGQEAGATVEYSTDNGHTWTSSFTPQQGSNTVSVRQTDTAGNVSTETSVSFTLDNTVNAPAVTLLKDTGRHSINTPDLITADSRLSIQTEAGAKVEYSNDGGHTWTTVFNPVEGVNDLQVRQTDIAGNVSPATHFSFTLDTTPGTVTVNPISQDNALNAVENNQPLVITGTTSNIAPGDVVYVVVGNNHFYDATVKSDGTWSLTLNASEHQRIMATDRDYPIQVGTVDTAGNSTPRISTHLLIDTQSPIPHIAVDSVTQDNVINAVESGQTIAITGTVTGDYHTGDMVSLKINGATISSLTGSVDASGHFSIPVAGSILEHANIHTSYANGQSGSIHSIEATIITTDAVGNVGSATTGSQVFSVDTHVSLPTITFENPGPDGLYSKAEISHGHPNTVTATITPPGDAKIGEHLVVNGQDHVLDAHTLQHGLQIEVSPGSQVQVTMTDEHGNTAGSQGVAASAIPEPIVVKPPSGSHQVSGTLGVPPLIPSQTPVPSAQNGWRIHLPNGQYVTSHHGQYGTLTIDPQTGHLHYQEQAQAHTGPHGSASGIGQHEDKFEISLQGANQDEVVAHVNVQILSHGPGHSGKLTIGTEVVDMTITPIVHATHPAPPPVQHDEPEIASHEGFTFTVSEDASLDLSQHAHQEPDQKTDHHGAAAYLDALGIQPNASPTMEHAQPADMDIVLAQVDQQHVVDSDQAHLDMSDALEHHDAANNQDDEHHHHNDVDGLPDIDPNN